MPDFVNAVAAVRTLLSPRDLLEQVQEVEARIGRTGGHGEPREVDVDIVALGTVLMDRPELTIPHPRYHLRAFVLLPLREVAPDFRCPLTGRRLEEMIAALPPGQRVRRISRRWIVRAP